MPYFFARLDLPSPALSAPGSPRMRSYSHRTNYQRVVISSANDFFSLTKIFSTVTQAYNFMSGDKILCSSGHLISETWPIEVPLIETFLVIQKITYLRCEQEGENVKWVITKLSPFFLFFVLFCFFWQTPNSLFRRSANRAKCVTSTGYGALNLYKTQFWRIMW